MSDRSWRGSKPVASFCQCHPKSLGTTGPTPMGTTQTNLAPPPPFGHVQQSARQVAEESCAAAIRLQCCSGVAPDTCMHSLALHMITTVAMRHFGGSTRADSYLKGATFPSTNRSSGVSRPGDSCHVNAYCANRAYGQPPN